MKVKMSIRKKMLINILTTSVIIFAFSIGYMSYKTRVLVLEDAKKIALSVTMENALKIEKSLTVDLSMLETLSDVYSLNRSFEEEHWKELYADIAKKVFKRKDYFLGFSASWEEGFYKEEEPGQKNRYYYHLERKNGNVFEDRQIKDLSSNLYQKSKELNKSALLEPRKYTKEGVETNKVYLSCPMRVNGSFAGYVVADFSSESFQKIIEEIKPYDASIGYLISNAGVLISHPDINLIGDTLKNMMPHYEEQFNLSEQIKIGNAGVFKGVDEFGKNILLLTAPIQVGELDAPWALTLIIPVKSILKEANKNQLVSLLVALFGIILISIIIFWRTSNIGSAIKSTTAVLEKLSKGEVVDIDDLVLNRGDEIDVMSHSVNLLKASLNETSDFAEQIGEGNLEAKFNVLGDNDKLGNSLLNMQQNLIKAKAEELKMKQVEEKNTWASTGLAKFGDIIRSNNENIETLSYNIVKNLVDYLGASMGALFVAEVENEETLYAVKAAVAYDRRKLIHEKVRINEGLVGRCVFECKPIYMVDVPDDYITIRSGLGDANPSVLLLVPLISEDKIFGVVELASFNPIEPYKVSFVEKLAENIASTLASVQINQRTVLLLEQSKIQSEELSAQEEEMRQNMEELQATQEEAARREQEMIGVINMIDNAVFKVEYNTSGKIINVNDKYSSFLNSSSDAMFNKSIKEEYKLLGIISEETDDLLRNLVAGIPQIKKVQATVNNIKYTIEEHYAAVKLADQSSINKIIKVSYVIA